MKKISEIDMYKANMAITTGLLVLYAVYWRNWMLYTAIGVSGLTLLLPSVARRVSWAWYKLAEGLGYINSRVLLSIIFYVFLLPLAIMYRMANKRALSLRTGRQNASLYVERNHQYTPKDFETMW